MTSARRYRLAWLSARRRAADEANLGLEAVEYLQAEISRLRALLASRESTSAGLMEYVGTVDGDEVYRLKRY